MSTQSQNGHLSAPALPLLLQTGLLSLPLAAPPSEGDPLPTAGKHLIVPNELARRTMHISMVASKSGVDLNAVSAQFAAALAARNRELFSAACGTLVSTICPDLTEAEGVYFSVLLAAIRIACSIAPGELSLHPEGTGAVIKMTNPATVWHLQRKLPKGSNSDSEQAHYPGASVCTMDTAKMRFWELVVEWYNHDDDNNAVLATKHKYNLRRN